MRRTECLYCTVSQILEFVLNGLILRQDRHRWPRWQHAIESIIAQACTSTSTTLGVPCKANMGHASYQVGCSRIFVVMDDGKCHSNRYELPPMIGCNGCGTPAPPQISPSAVSFHRFSRIERDSNRKTSSYEYSNLVQAYARLT